MKLASYIAKPVGVAFETQGRDEEIVLLLRRHPVTQLKWILFSFFLILLPLIGIPFVLEAEILPKFVTFNLLVFLILFWYIGTFGYSFMKFLLWFYNVNIVTNQRLVDIDFPFLLLKESTATRIEQIEDVTHKRGGFLRTILDFGDVFVQTAGAKPNIEFLDIPSPDKVVREIVSIWEEKEPERAGAFLAKHDKI